MAAVYLPCQLAIDDRPIGSDTVLHEGGSNVVTFITASAALDLELHSTYTGHRGLGELFVSELILGAGGAARLEARRLADPESAIVYARSSLLYDHLHRVQDLARERGEEVSILGSEDAAEHLGALA